jgi:hypothetical protein
LYMQSISRVFMWFPVFITCSICMVFSFGSMTHPLFSRCCAYVDSPPPTPLAQEHVFIKSGVVLPNRLSIVFHTMVEASELVITAEFMPVFYCAAVGLF